jgi:hypothetical protein
MSKRSLSPAYLPPAKRIHLAGNHGYHLPKILSFADALYDELILYIFSHLSSVDLCRTQATNRNWARLAGDNELWRNLYLKVYGRTRLRGAKGFIGRLDGRQVRPLPGRAQADDPRDWKWMFRISSNWRKGTPFDGNENLKTCFTPVSRSLCGGKLCGRDVSASNSAFR